MTKFVVVGLCLLMALGQMASVSGVTEAPEVEQSTESPIADMALIDVSPMAPKKPTEKPPVSQEALAPAPVAVPVEILEKAANPQPHTVADFIIHPLIAFKPRQASLEEIQGKQAQQGATTAAGGSPASTGTWLFGMNPAQQLGSSFSTLAGSVSGWFNDRLQAAGQQLPGLVETPVRESTTSTSSTTSTTTQRPDIVVRVQQRPQRNGNRNGGGVGNLNGGGGGGGGGGNLNNRRRQQRPNRFNNRLDSFEDDYYEDDYYQGNRFDEEFDDDEDEQSLEQFEDDDSLEQLRPQKQKPKNKRKQTQVQGSQNQRRKFQQQQQEEEQQLVSQKRRQQHLAAQNNNNSKKTKVQKKPVQPVVEEEEDVEDDDEEENDDEEEDQVQEDDSQEQEYQPAAGSSSTRRSQNQPNFIQRGQQSIISQIRQFTRGQTPGELATTLRRNPSSGASSSSAGGSKTRRPQQTTLLVNRNGQTVYLAPELLSSPYPYAYVQGGQAKKQRVPVSGSFPQPPLTVPVRRQGGGRPTQYITIPWSQLGLSPPDQQSVVSLAEGIQAQPLILNIPQSAISPVRGTTSNGQKKKQRPQLTASAVPLLADASLMDIFQPPQIPPSRTGTPSSGSPSAGGAAIKPISAQPVLIAAKPVKAGGLLPTRIRPGTIVEKAPAMEEKQPMEAGASDAVKQEQEMMATEAQVAPQSLPEQQQQEFILVGDDDEPGLSRHVQPAFGDARYVSYGDFHPYFDLLTQNRRFALRKSGRSLESPEEQAAPRALSTFGKAPVVPKEEVKEEEHQKEEVHKKEEHQKEEVHKKEVEKEEQKKEEVHKKEVEKEEQKKEEVHKKEVEKEDHQKEIKKEEHQKEEFHKKEEPHHEEHSKLPA
ncbi:hypothetical protein KR084_005723 [Drosophila pseudotakahashii]|nr:hypothetical protein KR084_005723 [Drosophila pseudotakahashii]